MRKGEGKEQGLGELWCLEEASHLDMRSSTPPSHWVLCNGIKYVVDKANAALIRRGNKVYNWLEGSYFTISNKKAPKKRESNLVCTSCYRETAARIVFLLYANQVANISPEVEVGKAIVVGKSRTYAKNTILH